MALTVQSALVWAYALESQRTAGIFWRACAVVGQRQRVATLLLRLKLPGRPRANPLLHADCLLGIGTGNVIWNNYETRHYYFPVQFHAGLDRPDAGALEAIARQDDPRRLHPRRPLGTAAFPPPRRDRRARRLGARTRLDAIKRSGSSPLPRTACCASCVTAESPIRSSNTPWARACS